MSHAKYTLSPIDTASFEAFAKTVSTYTLMQSPGIAQRRKEDDRQIHCLGLKRDGKIIAAAMLHARKLVAGLYEYECMRGPVVDFDSPLFDRILLELARYVKKHNGMILRINPPLLRVHRGNNGSTYRTQNLCNISTGVRICIPKCTRFVL